MADIFNEVEEELRKDKYEEALRKWWPVAAAAVGALVLGTAGVQGYDAWRTARIHASSEVFLAATRDASAGDLASAVSGFESLAESSSGGYAALALINRGALALEGGDNAAAAGFFEQAAAAIDEAVIRDLAELKAIWARWEELSFLEVSARAERLTATGAPYRHLARETIASAALRDGDLEAARIEFELLSFAGAAAGVPQGVQARAERALAVIGQREAAQAAAAPAEATPVETPAETPAEIPAEPAAEQEEPPVETDGGEE